MNEPTTFKILLPLRHIPDGGVVTKQRGEKRYTVSRCLRVFTNGIKFEKEPLEVKMDPSLVFLLCGTGDISAYPDHTEMLWHVSEDELLELLQERSEGYHAASGQMESVRAAHEREKRVLEDKLKLAGHQCNRHHDFINNLKYELEHVFGGAASPQERQVIDYVAALVNVHNQP